MNPQSKKLSPAEQATEFRAGRLGSQRGDETPIAPVVGDSDGDMIDDAFDDGDDDTPEFDDESGEDGQNPTATHPNLEPIETRGTDLAMLIATSLDPKWRLDFLTVDPELPRTHPLKVEAVTFLADRSRLRAWIDKRQGRKGVYIAPNQTREDAPAHKRPSKADIVKIRAIHVDLDPHKIKEGDLSGANFRRERERLRQIVLEIMASECPPTLVVDTGGGFQLWWILKPWINATPENIEIVEGVSRTLAARYGGDSTWDVSRVLRLPGTVNVPDADKKAQGRVAADSFLLRGSSTKPYTLEALTKWAPPTPKAASAACGNKKLPEIDMEAVEADDYGELPAELRQKFEAYCSERPVVAGLWRGEEAPGQTDPSASGFEFQLVGWLKQSGDFTPTECAQLIAVYPFRSEKHADELERRVKRAWANNRVAYGGEGFDAVEIAPRKDRATPAHDADDNAAGDDDDTAAAANTAAEDVAAPEASEQPTDLWTETGEAPSLPDGVVPQLIEDVSREWGRRLGVEPGGAAAALVASLGSLVSAGNEMQIRQNDTGWKVKPIIWTMLVGEPGSNKSAVLGYAIQPVESVQAQRQKEHTQQMREFNAARQTFEGKARGKTAAPAVTGAELQAIVADDKWQPAPEKPKRRDKICYDATTEKLADILSTSPAGILYSADEIAALFGGMDAYRQKGEKDRPFWLSAKEGRPYRVDRKSNESIIVKSLAISVLGGIQPAKMNAIKAGLTDDGLLQRFHPISIQRTGEGEDIAPDPILQEALRRLAFDLAESEQAAVFRFSPEADAEYRALEAFKRQEITRPDISPAFAQWLEKLPNEFGRVALVFHFVEWHSSPVSALVGDAPPALVSAETARRARRYLAEFVYPHARMFYERVLGASTVGRHALWIAGFILAYERTSLTARNIERAGLLLRGREHRGALVDAMHVLELEDWVWPIKWLNGAPTTWKVNPVVHDGRFGDIAKSELVRRGSVRQKIGAGVAARNATKTEPEG